MKKHHLYIVVVLPILAVLTIGLFIANDGDERVSAITPACNDGGYISINGASTGTTSSILPGAQNLSYTRSTAPDQIAQVYFTFDSETNFVGRASKLDITTWSMKWLSYVSPSGSHSIGAIVKTPTSSCLATPIVVLIDNALGMVPFNTVASPNQFSDYINVSRDFMLNTSVSRPNDVPVDVTQWAMYFRGPVSHGMTSSEQSSNLIRYFSGVNPGQGSFSVNVNYGGIMLPINVPLNVQATPTVYTQPASATPTTTTSSNGTPVASTSLSSTTIPPSSSTSTSTQSNPTAPVLDSDPIVKLCLIEAITESRYLLINSGRDRPTPKEFELSRQCFATRNYLIPVVYSPVIANKTVLKELEITKTAEVGAITSSTVKNNGDNKPAIKFSGRAVPNSQVLIYVFSEPLVLSTISNGEGEWSYSLEDPMEPGKHEAYALVSQGDGKYERSSVFNFAIAKASAATSNPQGYSFNVEANTATPTDNNYSTKLYVSAVVGLILAVLAILIFIFVRKKTKSQPGLAMAMSSNPKPVYTPPESSNLDSTK